jgi:hypothetical protein
MVISAGVMGIMVAEGTDKEDSIEDVEEGR